MGQVYGGRAALAIGGIATLLAAALGWRSLGRQARRQQRPVAEVSAALQKNTA
jgi:hypothetical protein